MQKQNVTIEPQIIQLGKQDTQMIKITNNTSNHLHNFFFCLYNVEKFQFSPDSFSLSPNQQKLIKISLRLKSVKAVTKQFAYLKSSETNKRITILINSFQSPQPKFMQESGIEEANTLSSRDYRQTQTAAFNKIINQKQAYIARLQRQIKESSASRHNSIRQNEKLDISNKQLECAQAKIIALQRQKQSLIQQNMSIHQRFQQYRILCQGQMRSSEAIYQHLEAKKQQIAKLYDQIRILEQQGSQFLRKLNQKEALGRQLQLKVKQLQSVNLRIADQIKFDNQKRIKNLQAKFQQQKKSYQNTLRTYQGKIKQLQIIAQSSANRSQYQQLQRQKKKLITYLQQQKKSKKQLQQNLKKQQQYLKNQQIRLQLLNQSLTDRNQQLIKKINNLQQQVQKFKQQGYNKKNKDRQNSSQKVGQYLQVALDSCKNQNDLLKKNYADLQRAYTRHQQSSSQRILQHQQLNNNLKIQLQQHKQTIQRLIKQKQQLQQQNHHNLMKLKIQNIQLFQKIAKNQTNKKIDLNNQQIHNKNKQIQLLLIQIQKLNDQLVLTKRQNKNLQTKISKYKKQAKNQLKNINQTAIQQLKRVHQQKKNLLKRVNQLQQNIQQSQNQKTRYKSKTGIQPKQDKQKQRKVGIKDQRKQLEQSRANSNGGMNSYHMEQLYQQLGQLRQLDHYIRNQQDRFSRLFGIQIMEGLQNGRSIFRAIKFFKQLQIRFKQIKQEADQSSQAIKQLQFMRGRITQLKQLNKQTKNQQQSITLNNNKLPNINNTQIMEFIRSQMKLQYKKLYQTIKLIEDKYNILKKKIYIQYRTRLISHLQKKDKNTIHQIEATLERFIQGLSNLSHKEAVLGKQIKLKQIARKQANQCKQKIKQLTLIIETKKGACSREPLRIWVPDNQLDWQQNIRLQAQLLSHDAQLTRLKQQLQILTQQTSSTKQQLIINQQQLLQKQKQNQKLKKQIVQLDKICTLQLQKYKRQNQQMKQKYIKNNNKNQLKQKNIQKQKQYIQLKKDLENKKQLIKSLKDRQKILQQMIQSSNQSQQRDKKKSSQQYRLQQTVKQLKQSNRQLRKQNLQIKQNLKKMEEQINRKTAYISSLKGDTEQYRIKISKKQENQNQKLKNQIKILKEQIKKNGKDQIDKIKKKKDKQIGSLEDQINRINNQNIMMQKSFQSIIRALIDTLRRIYSAIDLVLKKKGKRAPKSPDFESLLKESININALKVYQYFQEPLTLLQTD